MAQRASSTTGRLLSAGMLAACALTTLGCVESVERRVARIVRLESDGREASIAALETAARDSQPTVRALAVATLGRVAPARASAVALAALDDDDAAVRATAARTLGVTDASLAATALARVLRRDNTWDVRRRAAEALGAVGGDEAAIALRDALHDPEPEVRIAAARALGRVDPVGSVRICGLVMRMDDAWQVRAEAAQVLALAKTDEARAVLREAAVSDPNEFVRAVSSRGAGV